MQSKNKITWHQLAVIMFIGLFSPMIRSLFRMAPKLAGRAAWLAPLGSILPLALLIWMMYAFLKNREEDEGLGHMFVKALGTTGGKCIAGLYGVWLAAYSGFCLRSSGERLLSTVYDNRNLSFVLLLILTVVLIAALGRVRTLARSAEVFLIVFAVVLILVFIFTLPNVKKEYLFPVSYLDTAPVLSASVVVTNLVSNGVFFLFLAGHVDKKKKDGKVFVVWPAVMIAAIVLMLFATVGSLGADLAERTQNPFFVMLRSIRFFNAFERIESVIVALWTVADFVYLVSLLMISAEIFQMIFETAHRRGFVWGAAGVCLLCAYIIVPDGFLFQTISEKLVPAINLCLIFIGLPVIFFVGKVRKKV